MCFKNSPRGYTHTETDSLSFFEPSSSEGKKRPEPPPIFLCCFSLNKGKHISDRITCFSWTPLNARLLLKCRTPPDQRSKLGNQPWLSVKENESESCHKSTCNGSLEHLPGWKDPPASFTLRFAFPLYNSWNAWGLWRGMLGVLPFLQLPCMHHIVSYWDWAFGGKSWPWCLLM